VREIFKLLFLTLIGTFLVLVPSEPTSRLPHDHLPIQVARCSGVAPEPTSSGSRLRGGDKIVILEAPINQKVTTFLEKRRLKVKLPKNELLV